MIYFIYKNIVNKVTTVLKRGNENIKTVNVLVLSLCTLLAYFFFLGNVLLIKLAMSQKYMSKGMIIDYHRLCCKWVMDCLIYLYFYNYLKHNIKTSKAG